MAKKACKPALAPHFFFGLPGLQTYLLGAEHLTYNWWRFQAGFGAAWYGVICTTEVGRVEGVACHRVVVPHGKPVSILGPTPGMASG